MAYKRISPQPVVEGGTGAQTFTAHGVLLGEGTSAVGVTAVGTTGQVLTGVTGGDPTFQALPAGGATTFHTGSGDATVSAGAITIAGTTNQISTSGSGATVTIAVPSSPSFGGTTTVATGLTATTGNITATAGNIVLPITTSTTGQLTIGGDRFVHDYGTFATFVGAQAGNFTLTGNNLVGVGYQALNVNSSGSFNVCVGSQSGLALTTGGSNTFLGNGAAYQLVSGSANICIGNVAGFAYSGGESSNICIGNSGTTAESNVIRLGTNGSGSAQQSSCFIGGIQGITTANSSFVTMNTSTGQLGTIPNATVTLATGITLSTGSVSLPATTSTDGQIKINGSPALHEYGSGSVFVGSGAGNFTLTAIDTTALGPLALSALTSGNYNVAVGNSAGLALTSGVNNTLIGNGAAYQLVSGSYNLILGANDAGFGYGTTESSNIILSNEGVTGESNVIRIGTQGTGAGEQNKCFIAGVYNSTVGVTGVATFVDSAGQLGTIVSSIRYKDNVVDMDPTPVLDLNPVNFTYKSDKTETKQYGLIAEEVAEIFPDLVVYDEEGLPQTVKYHTLPVLLLAEIKKLASRVDELEARLKKKGH